MTGRKLVYVSIMLVAFVWTNLYIADLHITIRNKNKEIEQYKIIVDSLSHP